MNFMGSNYHIPLFVLYGFGVRLQYRMNLVGVQDCLVDGPF